jgi:hypothetical protein
LEIKTNDAGFARLRNRARALINARLPLSLTIERPPPSHFRLFYQRLRKTIDEGALSMSGSLFAELDRFCAQFALALHNSELQVYAVLTVLLVLGILLFPPRNDPDQA